MPAENRGYINVDELAAKVTLEKVAAFYGVELPELKCVGDETRLRCFLACGKTQETGNRALAIQAEHPAKPWACHQYGCGKNGNLVGLIDLLKPGPNMNGRPRGDRFKQIAADLRAMVDGIVQSPSPFPPIAAPAPQAEPPPEGNVPLAESPNERARALVNLDAKFITDPALMPPVAASYFRRRPFLSSEACHHWRMGYLPRDTGGQDKGGGTMRGRIVYGYADEDANLLTWFGRDPEFEEKHRRWETSDRNDREPEKFHFVKGFHRGQELFGQHRLAEAESMKRIEQFGLVVVEGPNDVIALDQMGVTAVALCSNTITKEQADTLAWFAGELSDNTVTLMLDCDVEGENGARQAVWEMAQRCRVRLAWTSETQSGRFKGRQPESVSLSEAAEFFGHFTRVLWAK